MAEQEMCGEFGEPWRTEKQSTSDYREFASLVDRDGMGLVTVGPEVYESCWYDIDEDKLHRIIACVNACAGIPTERLEKYGRKAVATGFSGLEDFSRRWALGE